MASKLSVITEQQAVPKGAAPAAGAVAPAAAGRAFASAERSEGPLARAFAQAAAPRPVLIAALFYRHAELAERLGASLLRCAEELRAIDGEVVFVNDSPDDAELAATLEKLSRQIGSAFAWRIQTNP